MRAAGPSMLSVLALFGCNSPAYDALIKGQEKWATMGSDSSGTTAEPDPGSDTGGSEAASADASAGTTGPDASTTGTTDATLGETTASTTTASTDDTTTGVAPFCGDGVVNTPFEECDDGVPDPDGSCSPLCQRARVIFITSVIVNGKLSGLQGADAYCRSQAFKAKEADPGSPIQEPMNFKALLPSSTLSIFARHFHGEGPYRLVNGLTVSDSFAQLFSEPLQSPINVDPFSQTHNASVWTASTKDGAPYPGVNFCNDWTGVKGSASYGRSDRTDAEWIEVSDKVVDQPTEHCLSDFALYCLEQQ